MRIGSVSLGSQRRGFFRIAILPELVGRNVEIIFSGQKIDAEALRDLGSALQTLANTECAELSELSIRTAGNAKPEIQAATALVNGDHDWVLTRAVVHGGQTAAQARLVTHGQHAGEVIFSPEIQIQPAPQT
jgi:hypothetical protein